MKNNHVLCGFPIHLMCSAESDFFCPRNRIKSLIFLFKSLLFGCEVMLSPHMGFNRAQYVSVLHLALAAQVKGVASEGSGYVGVVTASGLSQP